MWLPILSHGLLALGRSPAVVGFWPQAYAISIRRYVNHLKEQLLVAGGLPGLVIALLGMRVVHMRLWCMPGRACGSGHRKGWQQRVEGMAVLRRLLAPVQLGDDCTRIWHHFWSRGAWHSGSGLCPMQGLTLGPQHSSAGGGQQRFCSRTGHGPGQAAKRNVAAGGVRLCVSLSGGLGDDSAGLCCVLRDEVGIASVSRDCTRCKRRRCAAAEF